MRNILVGIFLLGLVGCAGVSFEVPGGASVQEINYKDIVNCKVVEGQPEFVDCKVKIAEGFFATVRYLKSEVKEQVSVSE